MTDKERIAMLEARVAQLESIKLQSTPWSILSKKIEHELDEVIDDHKVKHQIKSAMTCILGKAFNRKTVCMMNEQECKDAMLFVNFTRDFLSVRRDQYKHNKVNFRGGKEYEQRATNF